MDPMAAIYAEDRIGALADGFHLRTHGRGGFIYYVSKGRVLPIAIEMPGVPDYDILVFGEPEHLRRYVYPKVTRITASQAGKISRDLIEWLDGQGLRHDIRRPG